MNVGSISALRMNCRGMRGDPDPWTEGESDLMDRGLCPLGVSSENEGTKGSVGSGVFGGSGGLEPSAVTSNNVAELIHFSSWILLPSLEGESGRSLKLSAK